jgi:hypothetical protein
MLPAFLRAESAGRMFDGGEPGGVSSSHRPKRRAMNTFPRSGRLSRGDTAQSRTQPVCLPTLRVTLHGSADTEYFTRYRVTADV